MLLDDNFKMQGGVRNYLGTTEEVTAPKFWKSSKDSPKTELAYITEAEKGLLIDANLHGSLKDGKPNVGASGLLSYDGWGDVSSSGVSDTSSGNAGAEGGQGSGNSGGGSGYQSSNSGNNYTTPTSVSPDDNNQNTGNAREDYITNYVSKGIVKGGGNVTFLGGDKNDPSNYTVSDATVDSAVTQKEQEKYAEQFGGVAPLGSRPVSFNTKAEYNQMTYIAGSRLDSIKGKLKEAGFTDFNKNATLSEMKDYVKTLNRTGKIGDSWKNAKDTKGKPLYSPETIAKWESLNYFPQSPTSSAPGFFGKLIEKASPSGTLGAPLTYDQLLADFDTINEVGQSQGMGFQERMKTYQPNRYAAENGLLYNGKTKTFTMKEGGGNEQDAFTRSNAPYEVGETAPQESVVADYFSNMGSNLGVSSAYMDTYNAAKNKISQSLNLQPNNQQYGYGNTFNNTYARSMTSANPFEEELTNQGLI